MIIQLVLNVAIYHEYGVIFVTAVFESTLFQRVDSRTGETPHRISVTSLYRSVGSSGKIHDEKCPVFCCNMRRGVATEAAVGY